MAVETLPCPECSSQEGYEPVGAFRALCKSCGALLKIQEVDATGQERES